MFLWSTGAFAHGPTTAVLRMTAVGEAQYSVSFRVPSGSGEAVPVFPDDCQKVTRPTLAEALSQFSVRFDLRCARSLRGRTVGVNGLGGSVALAVVDVTWENDESFSTVLGPSRPSIDLPIQGDRFDVVRRYVNVGIGHIATGLDHLLVVLGLYILADSRKKLVLAISAFTVAHSVTLALASLGILAVRPALSEVWIGLSLVLLGLDVVGERRARLVPLAFVFGLVHGLGFAAGLREIGLVKSQLLTALVSFNVGVEVGQLAFVAAVAVVVAVGGRLRLVERFMKRPSAIGYLVGSLGAYFTLLRVGAMLRQ